MIAGDLMRKLILAMLFILEILDPLAYQPVSSQLISTTQTITESSTSTIVTIVFSTAYSTATNTGMMAYLQRPYDYDYRTGSFTLGQYEEISRPIMLPSFEAPEHICLYYDYFVFNAGASQEIRGHVATANPVNFYVLDLNQLNAFNGYFCGNNFGPSIVKAFASSYDLEWIPPNTGVYAFLFTTQRPYGAYNPISFIACTYNTTVQSTTLSYTTTSFQMLHNIGTVVSSLTTTGSTQNASETFLPVVLSILIFGLVIVFILIVAIKKRYSKP